MLSLVVTMKMMLFEHHRQDFPGAMAKVCECLLKIYQASMDEKICGTPKPVGLGLRRTWHW